MNQCTVTVTHHALCKLPTDRIIWWPATSCDCHVVKKTCSVADTWCLHFPPVTFAQPSSLFFFFFLLTNPMESLSTNGAAHSVTNKSVFNGFFALFLKVPQSLCVYQTPQEGQKKHSWTFFIHSKCFFVFFFCLSCLIYFRAFVRARPSPLISTHVGAAVLNASVLGGKALWKRSNKKKNSVRNPQRQTWIPPLKGTWYAAWS